MKRGILEFLACVACLVVVIAVMMSGVKQQPVHATATPWPTAKPTPTVSQRCPGGGYFVDLEVAGLERQHYYGGSGVHMQVYDPAPPLRIRGCIIPPEAR